MKLYCNDHDHVFIIDTKIAVDKTLIISWMIQVRQLRKEDTECPVWSQCMIKLYQNLFTLLQISIVLKILNASMLLDPNKYQFSWSNCQRTYGKTIELNWRSVYYIPVLYFAREYTNKARLCIAYRYHIGCWSIWHTVSDFIVAMPHEHHISNGMSTLHIHQLN